MEWRKISEERPPHGEMIWIWDNEKRNKFIITYFGDAETWDITKNHSNFPLWGHINEEKDNGMD